MFRLVRPVVTSVVALLAVATASAQERKPGSATIQLLQEKIDMKDLQQPMTLKDFLGKLIAQFEERKKEFVILVDNNAFREEFADAPDVYDTPIRFPAHPKTMPAASALRIALSQIPTNNATYLVRRGIVEVTTYFRATPGRLLQENIATTFQKLPLEDALEWLAEETGATIVVDQRVKDQIRTPVSASFRNTITLETAVRRLAEMAELEAVVEDDILWIRNKAAKEKGEAKGILEFKNRRLDSALAELAVLTNTTIILEPWVLQKIRDAMNPRGRRMVEELAGLGVESPERNPYIVSATFRGKLSAEHATRVLAHMAGLGVMMVGDVIYVAPHLGAFDHLK
jgi:hypothetical protein